MTAHARTGPADIVLARIAIVFGDVRISACNIIQRAGSNDVVALSEGVVYVNFHVAQSY